MSKYTYIKNKLIHACIIAIISFLFGLYASFSADIRFFTVAEQYVDKSWNGQVHSTYPNLGTIIVHFQRPDTKKGVFTFFLSDIAIKKILYQSKYTLFDIYYLSSFPFGFTPLTNSENREYRITFDRQLTIQKEKATYTLLYAFNKTDIFHGKYLGQFIKGKIIQYLHELIKTGHIIFYIAPSLFFLVYQILYFFLATSIQKLELKKQINEVTKPTLIVFLTVVSYDIILNQLQTSDASILSISLIWIMLILIHQFSRQKSFVLALFFLLWCPVLLIANMNSVAEKAATWAFVFMTIGTAHAALDIYVVGQNNLYRKRVSSLMTMFAKLNYFDIAIENLFRKVKSFYYKRLTFRIQIRAYSLVLKEGLVFSIVLIVITLFLLIIAAGYMRIMAIRDRKLKNPTIATIEPTLVYPGTKIVIYGKSFGEKRDNRYRLVRNNTEIHADYWEDDKIIFTVPLDWGIGTSHIWIEKPVEWNTATYIEKTMPVDIKILQITDHFTKNDDLYFEQMKTWRQETREINGYN